MVLDWMRHQYAVSVIAHRGYNAKYPENTLLAFEKAIDVGADYCELDIEFTKDGKIVVIHDDSTKRVADKDLQVTASTLAELKQLDLGNGQRIPTLAEVLELCEGKIGLNIEIKGRNMAKALAEELSVFNMNKDIIVSSFHHQEIIDFHQHESNVKIATLEPTHGSLIKNLKYFFTKKDFFQHAEKAEANAIHPFVLAITRKFIETAHQSNWAVNTWTSDNPKQWKKFIGYGIDGIITNNPEKLISFLNESQ